MVGKRCGGASDFLSDRTLGMHTFLLYIIFFQFKKSSKANISEKNHNKYLPVKYFQQERMDILILTHDILLNVYNFFLIKLCDYEID